MKEHNGYRSWNAWNVALWIGNDEPLYRLAMWCLEKRDNKPARAARLFMLDMGPGQRTPDGATYNRLSVKLAFEGLIE